MYRYLRLITIDIEDHRLTILEDFLVVEMAAAIIHCEATLIVHVTSLLVELKVRLG